MRDFVSLRDVMDRLFEDSFIRQPILNGTTVPFAVDLRETPDAYLLKTALPGMKPEDIAIDATAGMVTIKGVYKGEKETRIDPAKVEAKFAEGILEITLPKAEIVKPKQIKVEVGQ